MSGSLKIPVSAVVDLINFIIKYLNPVKMPQLSRMSQISTGIVVCWKLDEIQFKPESSLKVSKSSAMVPICGSLGA